jgi:hypothetical protein
VEKLKEHGKADRGSAIESEQHLAPGRAPNRDSRSVSLRWLSPDG